MGTHTFDVILIIFIAIILIHLYYNETLFSNNSSSCNETMNNVGNKKGSSSNINRLTRPHKDGEYRDDGTCGIDRVTKNKRWYHDVNKLVQKNSQSAKIKTGNVTTKKAEKCKNSDNDYKLVFDDYYEKNVVSDPYEIDMEKTTLDQKLFDNNNKDEKYTDVYGNVCKLNEDGPDLKRYIREYVLDGMAQCGCAIDKSKSDFLRDEVDEYREGQLDFYNKVNGTSDSPDDPVDKMNEITLCGGIKGNGQTIADYYDKLVDGKISNLNGPGFVMGSAIPTQNCVKPPELDLRSGIPQGYYTSKGESGKYILQDNWMYNNENPNNGGNYYDGIYGTDPMMQDYKMIKY